MANRLLSTRIAGVQSKQVTVYFDGDSKALEPFYAMMWAKAPQPLVINTISTFTLGVGGSTTDTTASTGLTNATRMALAASTLSPLAALGPVDVWLTIGTNDIAASTAPETAVSRIRKYHNNLRAAGVRFLILMATDPRAGQSAGNAAMYMAYNAAYQKYCDDVPDAIFCDPTGQILDQTSAVFAPIGGASAVLGGFSADGLHASGFGMRMKYPAVKSVTDQIYRKSPLQAYNLGDVYDATTNIRGNKLGTNGRAVSIGGFDGTTKSGSAAVTGTPPLGWIASGAIDGTLGITFTQANCTALDTLLGTSGSQCVRMAFTGAPASTVNIALSCSAPITTELNTIPIRCDALVNFNTLVGLASLKLTAGGVILPITSVFLGSPLADGSLTVADQMPTLSGIHEMGFKLTPTADSSANDTLTVRIRAGTTVSGSIDLIGLSMRRYDDTAAAAA